LSNQIIINRIYNKEEFEIVPLKRKRDWMGKTQDAFAYHCMPLNIANEYGWAVLSPAQFTATWNGTYGLDAITIDYEDEGNYDFAHSHFGDAVLTIGVDFVIKTPPEISTYIRGIPNELLDGLQSLDAIVETDWLPFTFTYNYRFTRPCKIRFYKDEPLFSFFPVKRGDVESYKIKNRPIEADAKLFRQYEEYANARGNYLDNMHKPGFDLDKQRYYSNLKSPSGEKYRVKNHVKKVKVEKVEE
jgi:hypothetical protein